MKPTDQFDLFAQELENERKVGRADRRLKSFAECATAIDRLFQDALQATGPSAFDEFIEFARRLSNLSVYNAMLVRLQRPGAAAVATEKKWNDKRREVKPGAIPIVVLRPFGPVSFLYEVSDTDGPPLPGEHNNPFVTYGEMDEIEWAKAVKHHQKESKVRIEEMNFGTMLAGNARNLQAVPSRYPKSAQAEAPEWLIQINKNHSVPTRYATLAHELGHIFCGHCGADPSGRWPDRSKLPYPVREAEAEAVSYLVCARRELDVASSEYLRGLIKDIDLRQVSLYAIFEAANRIEGKTK
ncbi:ImmA/IrrE family metallo-endopeptidase [Dechloromonas sp. H13]|uniref:ImmA/IrrE family metallo-endopeptidase n=1 Tax=Dechloromonas sp. H13 TaxID=2570193 RepID=UPI00188599DF|nr:ImmA/IrrE family metallo-endopeptidase [Dechloromonas sp. H13]